ncbi:unnamed protein product [Cuscuta epithymum]|uniref:FK506-binding protein n=1 Tax=Cuscuta epithymum TaxID=186058 RepID=A0AAV0BZX5_9ASTE|nr:unnamed protein product [Cuscuta epithymum]
MGFWGIELKPGKPYALEFEGDRERLHLSQATLGAGSSDKKAIVQCSIGGKKPIYLCSLLPERLETCPLNIEFDDEDEVTFSVKGNHHVHLSGFFLSECGDCDEDAYGSDAYEDGYAESDSGADDSFYDSEEDEFEDSDIDMYPSSPVPNSGVRIEEIVEDKNLTNENDVSQGPKKKKNCLPESQENTYQQIVVKSNKGDPTVESEDEDGFPIATSIKTNTEAVPNKPILQESDHGTDERVQNVKRKIDAVGQTTGSENAKQKKKNKKKKKVSASEDTCLESTVQCNDADVHDKEKASSAEKETNKKTTNEVKVETKKKKKRQEINGEQSCDKEIKSSMEVEEKTDVKPSKVRTYPNGLVIEELSMGKPDGKRAIAGKKVSVRYIGKLKKNGKIFDSNIGKAPFKFRLGIGEVIKGWDVGVTGMRVGDKRRLTIPPAMGYGEKGAGAVIPPNSWLLFDVELINVN